MALSESEFVTSLQAVAKLYRYAHVAFGRETATNNVADLTEAIADSARGIDAAAMADAARDWRGSFAALCDSGRWRELLDPLFRGFLRDLVDDNQGITDPAAGWALIYDAFLNGSATFTARKVVSRGITFDSSPAESGTGDGDLVRLTVDKDGQTIEGCYVPLDITVRCVQVDPNYHGEEVFRVTAPGARDALDRGAGRSFDGGGQLQGWNSDRSGVLLDASFDTVTVSADPASLGGNWTANAYGSANMAVIDTGAAGASLTEQAQGSSRFLRIKSGRTVTVEQAMKGVQLGVPYAISLRVRPGAGLTAGTLTVHWGSQSQALTLSGLTAGAWNLVTITPDSKLWSDNFAGASAPMFKLAFDGAQDDSVDVDLIRVRPFDFVQGRFLSVESDPAVPFQAGASAKTFVIEDALAGSDSYIQALIHFSYGAYLPASGGGTVIADPS